MIGSTAWLCVVFAFVAITIGSGLNLESQSRPTSGNDSIMLGAVELHLQMGEPQVVKSLSAEFELREHWTAGPNSVWEVCEKSVSKATPCLGSVVFENGKLLEASRRWPQVGTPASFAKALHAIAGRLVLEGHGARRLDVIA